MYSFEVFGFYLHKLRKVIIFAFVAVKVKMYVVYLVAYTLFWLLSFTDKQSN